MPRWIMFWSRWFRNHPFTVYSLRPGRRDCFCIGETAQNLTNQLPGVFFSMKLPLLCCCVALLAVSPSATACGHHARAGADLLSQLDLTDEQKAQIAQIRHTAEPVKTKRAEIFAVLTPDQKAQLKQLVAHRKG